MTTVTISSGPRDARIDPDSGLRLYRWGDIEVASVTSIRRMAGSPYPLVQWMVGKVCDRAVDEIDTLVAMMSREAKPRERVVEKNRRKEARSWLRQAMTEDRDAAATLGTAVHQAAEEEMQPGELEDFTDADGNVVASAEDVRPRLRQYYAWLDDSGAVPVLKERQVWNLTLGYAGSFDMIVRFPNGELYIVDIKTGKGTYGDHVLQQVAYLMAEFIGERGIIDDDATAILKRVNGVAILHLQDDGWEFKRLDIGRSEWEAFAGLLSFARWTHEHATPDSFTVASKSGAAPELEPVA